MKFSYSEWFTLYFRSTSHGVNSALSYQGIKNALQSAQKHSRFEVPSLDRKDLTEAIQSAVAEGILKVSKSDKNYYSLNKSYNLYIEIGNGIYLLQVQEDKFIIANEYIRDIDKPYLGVFKTFQEAYTWCNNHLKKED